MLSYDQNAGIEEAVVRNLESFQKDDAWVVEFDSDFVAQESALEIRLGFFHNGDLSALEKFFEEIFQALNIAGGHDSSSKLYIYVRPGGRTRIEIT